VDYEPVRLSVPARYAAYSANLFLLTVIAAREVTVDQLFPDGASVVEWVRTARLWQSQFPDEAWFNLVQSVTVSREWDGQSRQVRISLGDSEVQPPDPYWTYDIPSNSRFRSGGDFSWIRHDHDVMRAEAAFLCAANEDIYVHALEPLFERLGKAITTFHDFRARGPVSAAQALLTLWLRTNEYSDELTDAAETCVRIVMGGFAPFDKEVREEFRVLVLKHLARIRGDLPDGWVDGLHKRFAEPCVSG
jgi:hypothetical protein